jgi:hypothetical protein
MFLLEVYFYTPCVTKFTPIVHLNIDPFNDDFFLCMAEDESLNIIYVKCFIV